LEADSKEPRSVYFDLQAGWGVSKHIGGAAATRELASFCSIDGSSNVLVAGCGNGFSACMLARELGCKVVGVDINPAMVERSIQRARKMGLAKRTAFTEADATALPFVEEQFDVVFSESVNSFMLSPVSALREYRRVLVEGGRLGFNECVWLSPPPAGLKRYMERVTGARFLGMHDGWDALLWEAGFESPSVSIRRMSIVRQWQSEGEQLDAADVARAWLGLPRAIFTNADSRRWMLSTLAMPPSIVRLFHYFGYGLFTATKLA